MSESVVTREGSPRGQRPGREASPAALRGGKGSVVPDAEFTSYYGRPILKEAPWAASDIAGYLFLGGLAGASSVIAAGADAAGRRSLATVSKVGALGAIGMSTVLLIHDLGVPSRFPNMLRVFKPTSPMSMGSWILAVYGPSAGVAAATHVTRLFPRLGATSTALAALTGPAVATYTAVLLADTAVPVWHEAYRELPFVFAGSSACAAAGLALTVLSPSRHASVRVTAFLGGLLELTAARRMRRGLGFLADPYRQGRAALLTRAAETLTAAASLTAPFVRTRRAGLLCGSALLLGSALTRLSVFEAGRASAADPQYTVIPQRLRKQQQTKALPPPAT
ncbi:NrfD/PsrC family molybdoenzyme membrane anchor subunit [Actinocorallia populi]|uniref:NrfD/PsrC family molybdoenzyme membrane anchor subunit n=1 Tax=Actinocorallia populi TaxID=2079200 RepID=UPI000D090184|nr:NrfD/PsrC family molybdoenzyme membrane anchor subunit [Actinocorallia populi]